jgi:two-component system, NarL family, nitrate/nitrite response regulator NarL
LEASGVVAAAEARDPPPPMDDKGTTISVLIVGGARAHQEGLAEALERAEGFGAVEAVPSIDAALGLLGGRRVDVVLLDVQVEDCIDAVRTLVASVPQPRVVAFGVTESERYVVALAEAGVSGYVPRTASLMYLKDEITSVARGQLLASPAVAAILLRRVRALANEPRGRSPQLSARKREILALLEEGLSNKQIAGRLSIEVQTVKNHVHNLLDELGLRSRTEAAAWARRNGHWNQGGS